MTSQTHFEHSGTAEVARQGLLAWWFAALLGLVAASALAIMAMTGREMEGVHVVHVADASVVRAELVMPYPDGMGPLVHYAEHLTWLNAIGGAREADRHSNAWTSPVAVGYWLSGAPEDLPALLETLSGVFLPINLPGDFAKQERDILLREYELRMANGRDAEAVESLNGFLYDGNGIAASVIGTPRDIMALGYDDARRIHATTHMPENAQLVVTGDLSQRQVRRALRDAGFPMPDVDRSEIAPPPFELAPPETTTLRSPDPGAAPRLIWRRVVTLPEPNQFDLLEAQTALLRDILDTNLPGGLAGPLRLDAAIVRSFDVQVWPIDEDNIEISFTAAPDAGVSLTELRAAFEATLSAVASTGIPEPTYSRVLNRFDSFWPDWDDEDETASWMADYVLDRVSSLRNPLSERELKRLHRKLSLDSTNALLRQLAREGRTAIAFIGPEESFE